MDMIPIILSVSAGLISVIIKQLSENEILWKKIGDNKLLIHLLKTLGLTPPKPEETYRERMSRLMRKFEELTSETTDVVSEIERNIDHKEKIIQNLEIQEADYSSRIQTLRNSPYAANIEIQKRLDTLIEDQNRESKKSKWRDFMYYLLGTITPLIITLLGSLCKAWIGIK